MVWNKGSRSGRVLKWSLVGLGVVVVGLAVLPMPHGGTLGGQLLGHLWREIQVEIETRHQRHDWRRARDEARDSFFEELAGRFEGAVSYVAQGEAVPGAWQPVMVEGTPALLHKPSGMIYGPAEDVALPDWSPESLVKAEAKCQERAPAGYWAVPTHAEMDLALEGGILRADPTARGRWIVRVVGFGGQGESFAPYDGPGLRAWAQQGGGVGLRCIARTAKAPLHGLTTIDVAAMEGR